ncbi:MAG: hypothetical protein ACI90V_011638 [Bacillariaceae sp.]
MRTYFSKSNVDNNRRYSLDMEKADPDDLSVEATTFDEEESESSSSSMLSFFKRTQQEYSAGSIPSPPSSLLEVEEERWNGSNNSDNSSDNNNNKYSDNSWYFDELKRLPKEIRNIMAGGFAGMIAKSVVAPFDRIKILYQVSSAEFKIMNLPKIAKRIVKEEGLSALWKGHTATLIRVFPYSGIQFMVFDRCKTFVLREQEHIYLQEKAIHPETQRPRWGLSPLESLCAGMTAGAVSCLATYPLDLTRAQLAVLKMKKGGSSNNMGFGGALHRNYLDRGVTGLFRGITPTLMGILPYSGIAFSFNEQAKRKVNVLIFKK